MPTIDKVFAFPSDLMGLVEDGQSATIDLSWLGSDGAAALGCLRFNKPGGGGITEQEVAKSPLSGTTWETWGVPAGQTVSKVQFWSGSKKLTANTLLTSHRWSLQLTNAAATDITGALLVPSTTLSTSVDASWQPLTQGTQQTVNALYQASNQTIRLFLVWNVTAAAGVPNITQLFDDLVIRVSYGTLVPSAPQAPVATAGNAQVALSWTAPADSGGSAITAYKIYRSTTSNNETLYASPAGTGTTYTDVAVTNGTTYYYRISALNAAGDGPWSNEVSATPSVAASPPSAPLNLLATSGDSQVVLNWTVPVSDGGSPVTGYKIWRGLSAGTETLLIGPLGIGPSYTDATAVNGTTYYYKVSAVNVTGESPLSNESSATPAPIVAGRTFKRLYGPTQLGNTAALLYTVPDSATAVVRHVHVSNPSGAPVNFTLSIGANTAATRVWDAQPIPANDLLDHYQEFTLVAGETIQGFAGSAATLNLTIDGYELGGDVEVAGPIFPSNTLFPSETSP